MYTIAESSYLGSALATPRQQSRAKIEFTSSSHH
jgi:hypothetical protein